MESLITNTYYIKGLEQMLWITSFEFSAKRMFNKVAAPNSLCNLDIPKLDIDTLLTDVCSSYSKCHILSQLI